MTIDKQLFVKRMNIKSKYIIDEEELKKYIETANKEINQLQDMIVTLSGINPNNKKDMLSCLNNIEYSSEKHKDNLVKNCDENVSNNLVSLITIFRQVTGKLDKFNSLKVALNKDNNELSISPIFSLNKIGAISLAKPTLPFTKKEIQKLLGFNCALHCKSLDEIIDFLIENKSLIIKTNMQSNFIISGTILYFNLNIDLINSFTIFQPLDEEWFSKYMIEFFNKYIEVMTIDVNLLQIIRRYVGYDNWEVIKK